MEEPTVTRWAGDEPPTESTVLSVFQEEGLLPQWWSNGPGDRYAAHSHGYHKVLYCFSGSIRFRVEPSGEEFPLSAGDRLDIPPGTEHSAIVGQAGVRCVEAPRR